jgi:beta-galactosidase
VEEFDPMLPGQQNKIVMDYGTVKGAFTSNLWADIIRLEGATALATYEEDFFAGSPAVTVNSFGKGKAYYAGTHGEAAFTGAFVGQILQELNIQPPVNVPSGVEVTQREKDGQSYLFIMNHLAGEATIQLPPGSYTDLISGNSHEGELTLPSTGVVILNQQG